MRQFNIVAAALLFSAGIAQAGVVERACLSANRSAASRSLCGCIQDAANMTLNRRDQKLAATFFKDPAKAQEIRQSDRGAHEDFWNRYKLFGSTAEAFCR